MNVLRLLRAHAGDGALGILLLAVGGGVGAAIVVALANAATAEGAALGQWHLGVLFLLVLGLMYVTRRRAASALIDLFERTLDALRQRFAERLRRAPLREVEVLEERLAGVVGDLSFISVTMDAWVTGVQQLAFVVSTTVVVASISGRALVLWLITLGAMVIWLRVRMRRVEPALGRLSARSAEVGRTVGDLCNGFAQVKLDARVARRLADEIDASIEATHAEQLEVERISLEAFVGAALMMFVLGSGIATFGAPTLVGLSPQERYEMLMFFELALAPLFGVLGAIPQAARSEAAARSVLDALEALGAESVSQGRDRPPAAFETLGLRAVEFRYPAEGDPGASSFVVGPVDLEIRRGELVLITGGNGSGKTTLMKLLMGLYVPHRGGWSENGQQVVDLARWRARFTAIMSHQYLFDRLYGIDDTDRERVDDLLARLGIADIVSLRDGGLTPLSLSVGQRMRLAMVVALLEDRPVLVFDEWTANQDPEMTRWYYDVLLPELRARGKTVIAVSHDERFFDRADHFVRLDRGRVEVSSRETGP